jgi:uncharacterized protein
MLPLSSDCPPPLSEKYQNLLRLIASHGRVAVAFSGGVDSSLLCRAAKDALGDAALAITMVSPMMPGDDLECAKQIATLVGIPHILVEDNELDEPIAANPINRCYHCKKIEFGRIAELAREHNIKIVLDGSNIDDESDYRPGLIALGELGVVSPLRLAGLNKAEIRALSKNLGLPTWDKPAAACLGSRIPYGQRITLEKLQSVEKAEQALRSLGFRQCRVRHHDDIARIEVGPEERHRFFDTKVMDEASRLIKAAGYRYVCLELEGYRTGSLNRVLGAQPANA